MKKFFILCFLCITLVLCDTTRVLADEIIDYPNEYVEVFNNMTQEDWSYLAKCVMCEAGHSNLECCEGTVCVILNRVLNQRSFKKVNTVTEVVNQRGQFVTKPKFKKAKPNALVYTAIANVQNHGARVIRDKLADKGWDLPSTDYVFFATSPQSYADNHIMVGIDEPGQKHYLATEIGIYE